jgi:uncharacterized repeat protein (TIGR02543 family)
MMIFGTPACRTLASRFGMGAFLVAAALAPALAQAQAVFTLQDQTNLPQGTYQIYVTGFSTGAATVSAGVLTNPSYILQPDGSWATPTAPSSTVALPCYRFPQDITQIQINGAQAGISARVYYFIVTDKTTFPQCTPAVSGNGLFKSSTAFTYSTINPLNLNEPATVEVSQQTMPGWTYSEIGASSGNGTIDLSQVDFFAFPMNSTANVLAATPANPSEIGNPIGSTANPNPNAAVNHMSIRDSYRKFIDALAEKANDNQTCAQDSSPTACAYLDLLQDVTTPSSTQPQYVIQNPGGYLGQYSSTTQASRLNTVFDGVIGKLWSTTNPPQLVLNTGGALPGVTNSVPQDTFTSSIVSITYPGSNPAMTVTAMKFTGTAASNNMVAYIVNPKDYQTGCGNGSIPNCVNAASTGYQVFAGAGVFGTPAAGTFTALSNAGLLSTMASTDYGDTGYYNLVARLGFLISGAMNRGVALASCATWLQTWQCWQDETYWYPTEVAATAPTFPDITQNLFSRWMHTATIGGVPMFVRPAGAVKSASGLPGQGKTMGMAYGFSNDENPTPQIATTLQPEVPSKFDGTVVYGTSSLNTITFGPWVTAAQNPTLTVVSRPESGTVTSTPGDIDCGTTCSQAYAPGTVVTLTATPAPSWIWVGWQGGGCGTSSTCTLTLNASTTVTALFGAIAAAVPTQNGLHVVVSGAGSVTSAPSGIDCGSACSKAFPANSQVTLTASPAAGSAFAGWSGACAGSALTCVVTMAQSRNVGASFVANAQPTLSVTGAAGGTVVSFPAGVDCGTRCIAGFASGTQVGVTARPNPGYRFAGWSGACSGTQTCDITLSGNAALQASFAPVAAGQYALTVRDYGEGTIQSLPAGIACGTSCSTAFAAGTSVTLVATPKSGYTFAGWTGACSGTGACVVYMDDLASVNAFFVPVTGGAVTPASAIPTLSQWALVVVSLLVFLAAGPSLRRRSRL